VIKQEVGFLLYLLGQIVWIGRSGPQYNRYGRGCVAGSEGLGLSIIGMGVVCVAGSEGLGLSIIGMGVVCVAGSEGLGLSIISMGVVVLQVQKVWASVLSLWAWLCCRIGRSGPQCYRYGRGCVVGSEGLGLSIIGMGVVVL